MSGVDVAVVAQQLVEAVQAVGQSVLPRVRLVLPVPGNITVDK